jgi:hypothetical protein
VVKLTESSKSVYICFVGKTDLHLVRASSLKVLDTGEIKNVGDTETLVQQAKTAYDAKSELEFELQAMDKWLALKYDEAVVGHKTKDSQLHKPYEWTVFHSTQPTCGELVRVWKGKYKSDCLAVVVKVTETGKSVYILFI